jgi:hypothetical protein
LRDVLGSHLEDLQRMSMIVQDMLFLSQADRGLRPAASTSPAWQALRARWWNCTRQPLRKPG